MKRTFFTLLLLTLALTAAITMTSCGLIPFLIMGSVDNDPLVYEENADGSYTVTGYDSEATITKLTIPSEHNGKPVTSIGNYAFGGCSSLTSVTIGESVESIGDDAFRYCDSLTSITIPDSVTSIGHAAFYNCTSLTSVTIGESVESIGECAFYYCKSLTSVTIPDSVTSIGSSAFAYCFNLTSVTIGESVESIGERAFYDCRSLTSIKYRGTRSQWSAIPKGDYWNSNTGSYTITYNYDGE